MRIKRLSISFFIRKRNAKSKEGKLYAKITWGGKSVHHSMDVTIPSEHFSKGDFKRNFKSKYSKLRLRMEKFREQINDIQHELISNGDYVTAAIILTAYKKENEEIYLLRDGVNVLLNNDVKESTKKQYTFAINSLRRWIKAVYDVEDILIEEMNQGLLDEIGQHAKKSNSSTYIALTFAIAKRIYVYYADKGYVRNVNLKVNFKPRTKERVILSNNEIKKLQKLSNPGIERYEKNEVRLDLFLFMCFTGLSHSDTVAMKYSDIETFNRNKIIDMSRFKTGHTFVVPVFPEAERIIEKYRNYKFKHKDKVFPCETRSSIRYTLTNIAEDLKIKKTLSPHIARHTFATTICMNNGVDLESVSGMLGHKSIKTTQIYAKINKERILKGTANLYDKLSKNT